MRIKYQPDPKTKPDERASTNIGSFLPGEVRGVGPDQEAEAARLIENGDFVESDEDPNGNEIAETMADRLEEWNAEQEKAKAAAAKAEPAKASAETPAPTVTTEEPKKPEAKKGKK